MIAAAADASTGRAYVNFLGDPDAARSAYGEETYARLVALKNEYDPTNVFRLNQNIEPRSGHLSRGRSRGAPNGGAPRRFSAARPRVRAGPYRPG